MSKFPRGFGFVIFFLLLNSSFSFVNMLLVPIFVQQYGYSAAFALKIQTFSFLAVTCFLSIFSRYLNRNYIVPIFIIIIIGLSCGVFSLMFPPAFVYFFILTIPLYMIAKSSYSTFTAYYLEGTSTKKVRLRSSAYLHMVGNAGGTFSGVIAYFYFAHHKTVLLSFDFLTSLILAVILFVFIRVSSISSSNEASQNSSFLKYLGSLDYRNILFIIGSFCFGISALCSYSAIPAVFTRLDLDPTKMTSLMAVTNMIIVTIGTFIVGRYSIMNKYFYLMMSCLLLAIGMFLVPYSTSKTMIIISTVVWTLSEAIGWPIIIFYIYETFTKSKSVGAQFKNIYLYTCMFLAPCFAWIIQQLPLYFFCIVFAGFPLLAFIIFKFISSELKEMQNEQ